MGERSMKELNILILGETGVGKSTWINGIVNYFSYSGLAEAESQKFLSVIPTSFSVTNDDYEEVIIRTGDDTNEDAQAGNSATQYPKSYTFSRGDTLVRFIDTPGIGDVRGITQDKENFKRILDHLSHVPEIHGICILLKPNNARLTIFFQFCIKELLTHLHRDASKNIVFCFTNTRCTFYKPGDTLPALKRTLNENKDVEIPITNQRIYCFDNEAFRFLAAVKNGIVFSDNDRINFSASWDKSVEEIDRLLTHIQSLKPHITQDTISLNDARKLIVALTKPLEHETKNIQDNIYFLKDKQAEITKDKKNCSDSTKLAAISNFVDSLQSEIKVLESKQADIAQVSAEFAAFLQQSATTPYNDATADYLDHLIREEQDKVTLGKYRNVLDSLIDMKNNYTHEVNILKESISSSSSNKDKTPPRFTELVDKLCKLKETGGAQLKQTIDFALSSNRNALPYLESYI